MSINQELYAEMMDELLVDKEYISQVAGAFRWDLEQGLKHSEASSLQMLPSFIGLPEGNETGEFLSLDFGGTNVRASVLRLLGNGRFELVNRVSKPLITDQYNYVNSSSSADKLFGLLADVLIEAVGQDKEKEYLLGHTFSFGTQQSDINKAKLIRWSKEFAVPDVEGKDINAILAEALISKGYSNIKPVAIINDTVAVLLAAAYVNPDTRIGTIYATGSNSCYMEPMPDVGRPACVINMESGGFAKLIPTKWDMALDKLSEKPGLQRLEKMVSGRYIGQLYSMMTAELLGLEDTPSFSAIDMSAIMEAEDVALKGAEKVLSAHISGLAVTMEELKQLQDLAVAIAVRSSRLVAATLAGTLWHLAGSSRVEPQHIAVDGSVYEHMPHVKENLLKALYELMGEEAAGIKLELVKDGSGQGAAIAAAVASQSLG